MNSSENRASRRGVAVDFRKRNNPFLADYKKLHSRRAGGVESVIPISKWRLFTRDKLRLVCSVDQRGPLRENWCAPAVVKTSSPVPRQKAAAASNQP